jgi:hypothetical protein
MRIFSKLILLIGLSISAQSFADTIFADDFQDGNYNGWSIGGKGASAYANPYAGNYSLRLRFKKMPPKLSRPLAS